MSPRGHKRNESIDTRRRDAESPYTPSIFLCIRQLFRRSTVQRLRKKREKERKARISPDRKAEIHAVCEKCTDCEGAKDGCEYTYCSLQRFNPIAEIPEEKLCGQGGGERRSLGGRDDYLPLKERLTWRRGDGNMQIA